MKYFEFLIKIRFFVHLIYTSINPDHHVSDYFKTIPGVKDLPWLGIEPQSPSSQPVVMVMSNSDPFIAIMMVIKLQDFTNPEEFFAKKVLFSWICKEKSQSNSFLLTANVKKLLILISSGQESDFDILLLSYKRQPIKPFL